MEPYNIMNLLTPKPPFNPKRKNQAVKFNTKPVNTVKATVIKLKK